MYIYCYDDDDDDDDDDDCGGDGGGGGCGGGSESYVMPCKLTSCFPRPFFTKNPWPNVSSAAS